MAVKAGNYTCSNCCVKWYYEYLSNKL